MRTWLGVIALLAVVAVIMAVLVATVAIRGLDPPCPQEGCSADYLHDDNSIAFDAADSNGKIALVTPRQLAESPGRYAGQPVKLRNVVVRVIRTGQPALIGPFIAHVQFMAFTRADRDLSVLLNDDHDYVNEDRQLDCCTTEPHSHMEKGGRRLGDEETYPSITGRWLPTAKYPIGGIDQVKDPYALWVAWADNG
jgi:hypothetical protein